MNYYTICPTCGYKLLKAGDGSLVEITCLECNKDLTIEISNNQIRYSTKDSKD